MIKVRQKLGKYRIERKLGEGGFATVYQATDTIEGVSVALKIPHARLVDNNVLDDFRNEVRLAAQLHHPNILPLKNAEFIEGHFVVTFPLGEQTLADRLTSRIAIATALSYSEQILQAVAYAHEHRIIHCDIKPENLILFPDSELMLTDFGIAKVALQTIRASGSGTVGFMAPEQAMGRPSFRSDVFSIGLILYRLFSGQLPEWPIEWPPPGHERLKARLHPDLIDIIRRAIEIDPKKRFSDAGQMLSAYLRIKPRALRSQSKKSPSNKPSQKNGRDWRTIRRQQFQKQFGRVLETNFTCNRCNGPVSECMTTCPWCGTDRSVNREETEFPQSCPRCRRGLKLDWHYCPWCYGAGFDVGTTREYSDKRYSAKCSNSDCERKSLMPFMCYCPWCRRKVTRKWKIEGSTDKCSSCGWGIIAAFWSYCPWCSKAISNK